MTHDKLRCNIQVVWGCWLFGFGMPVPSLWVLAFGPLRIKFWHAGEA